MRFLFLLFLMVLPFCLLGQIELNGVVLYEEEKEPLPGVTILIKGTESGVATNVEGEFEITVPKVGDTLLFMGVGLESQEVIIRESIFLEIIMNIGGELHGHPISGYLSSFILKYLSGILNTPYGTKINFFYGRPHPMLNFGTSYQTDFKQNHRYAFNFELNFSKGRFLIHPSIDYQQINIGNDFQFESIYLSGSINRVTKFSRILNIIPQLGYSILEKEESSINKQLGFGAMILKSFHIRRVRFNFSFSGLYWEGFWELKTSFDWAFGRGYSASIGYEKIQNFEEMQLSFGRRF